MFLHYSFSYYSYIYIYRLPSLRFMSSFKETIWFGFQIARFLNILSNTQTIKKYLREIERTNHLSESEIDF